jgi:purine-binding chemotaxis protein CheW
LLCRTGKVFGALPIENVIEIMRMLPVEPVTGAPSYVRGLSIVRGAPVPVVDLGVIVSGEPCHAARLVTVRSAARIIALAVETIVGATAFAADALSQLAPLLQNAETEAIAGVGALDAELLVFLRTSRLVTEDVLARLDAEAAP